MDLCLVDGWNCAYVWLDVSSNIYMTRFFFPNLLLVFSSSYFPDAAARDDMNNYISQYYSGTNSGEMKPLFHGKGTVIQTIRKCKQMYEFIK